jgi:hypothetical protein
VYTDSSWISYAVKLTAVGALGQAIILHFASTIMNTVEVSSMETYCLSRQATRAVHGRRGTSSSCRINTTVPPTWI